MAKYNTNTHIGELRCKNLPYILSVIANRVFGVRASRHYQFSLHAILMTSLFFL